MATFKQYEKKNGSKAWQFQAYLGSDPITGKPIKTTRRNFKTKKEAQLALSRLQVDFNNQNNQLNTQSITFKQLYDLWLEQYRLKVKPSTVATARRFIEDYCLQYFGNLQVRKISVPYCQKIVNKWHSEYKQYHYFRKVVGQVLQFGIQMELIESNPMRKTLLPRRKEVETFPNFYTKQQLESFFAWC